MGSTRAAVGMEVSPYLSGKCKRCAMFNIAVIPGGVLVSSSNRRGEVVDVYNQH